MTRYGLILIFALLLLIPHHSASAANKSDSSAAPKSELEQHMDKITSKRTEKESRDERAWANLDRLMKFTDDEVKEFIIQNTEELGQWMSPMFTDNPTRASTDALSPMPAKMKDFLDLLGAADHMLSFRGYETQKVTAGKIKENDVISKALGFIVGGAGTAGTAVIFGVAPYLAIPGGILWGVFTGKGLARLTGGSKKEIESKRSILNVPGYRHEHWAHIYVDKKLLLIFDTFDASLKKIIPEETWMAINGDPTELLSAPLRSIDDCSKFLRVGSYTPRKFLNEYRQALEEQKLLEQAEQKALPAPKK